MYESSDSQFFRTTILLMIPSKEKEGWHYCIVKKLYIIKRNNLKINGQSYCLKCLHSFRIKSKLKSHQRICKNKDFCGIVLPSQKDNILKFNQRSI